jgi:glycosyltransferase involved in cell wall biosynthesis
MSKHNEAILAFQEGRAAEAVRLLEELLAVRETSELWNDWAAMQLGVGQASKAETGFARALELDSQNADATASLGLLLLGRGDSVRAVPLLTRALPALSTEQQTIVQALLAGQPEQPSSARARAGPRTLRILVINDIFPDPKGAGCDLRLMQIIRTLRERGEEVTFIAREVVNGSACEPPLRQAGIQTYGNDSERLPCLGHRGCAPSWSFRELVEQVQFEIAILIHSFKHGISVPEQYLDDLRLYSPATRIVVIPDRLHIDSGENDGVAIADFERAEDWSARQWETFQRADVVFVPNNDDAVTLRKIDQNLQVEEIPHTLDVVSLASAQQRVLAVIPKARVEDCCSVMLVEKLFRESLSSRTGEQRILGQLECYVRLAEQLLRDDKPEEAHEQLRHVFGRLEKPVQTGYFASQVLIVLKRCYRKLGNAEMEEQCAAEARRRITVQSPAVSRALRRRSEGPLFSVIVPTYNRLPILRKCLAALEAQTLPATDFEVIVIDDGSSDGTAELLTQYRPPFHLRYLRQTNSGTGAARRNGVAHANGEYLLLMNDDTICARDLLEQHLKIQRAYLPQRWAVLGDFEYPAASQQRALTRYFCVEPFMFPQVSMEAGCPYGYSHFITCNLSVRRDAVVEAGSFDSTYKLSEDTELGIRLHERGYRVLYHPSAHAFHDHLPYPARNLIRRARVYGADYFHMFRRHPRVITEWAMPVNLTGMDEENAMRILGYVEDHRLEVEQAFAALERWDSIDFEPLVADQPETATMVLRLFQQAVPAIHWFYLFETMLHTMIRELGLKHPVAEQPPMGGAQATGD